MPIYIFQKITNIALYEMLYKVKECVNNFTSTQQKRKIQKLISVQKDLNIWTIVAKKWKQNIIYLTQRKTILISKNLQILLHK